jgi:hypothetical protein
MEELRYSSTILDLGVDRDEWLASRLSRFNPCIHWIGDWMGPKAGLDAA